MSTITNVIPGYDLVAMGVEGLAFYGNFGYRFAFKSGVAWIIKINLTTMKYAGGISLEWTPGFGKNLKGIAANADHVWAAYSDNVLGYRYVFCCDASMTNGNTWSEAYLDPTDGGWAEANLVASDTYAYIVATDKYTYDYDYTIYQFNTTPAIVDSYDEWVPDVYNRGSYLYTIAVSPNDRVYYTWHWAYYPSTTEWYLGVLVNMEKYDSNLTTVAFSSGGPAMIATDTYLFYRPYTTNWYRLNGLTLDNALANASGTGYTWYPKAWVDADGNLWGVLKNAPKEKYLRKIDGTDMTTIAEYAHAYPGTEWLFKADGIHYWVDVPQGYPDYDHYGGIRRMDLDAFEDDYYCVLGLAKTKSNAVWYFGI
jgi:hypothetical protein